MMLGMVAAGAGVALVPASARRIKQYWLVYRPLEPMPNLIETALAWRQNDASPVLAEFVRAERHLRLPEAIRKMTSFPAQRLGLPDRGLLRDGFKADIVVFNPNTVKTHATRQDPKHYPLGIEYVIVNGIVVIDRTTNTGALPGRALRRGNAST
jgi:N-acyl-D-aspartate/D-glutamate deacylase